MYGFGALRKLIYKANKGGALIEGIVTYAALVDGFLRIGLILKRQLINKNEDIDLALISQTSSTQYLSERKVFKLALTESVIEPSLFSVQMTQRDSFGNDGFRKVNGWAHSDPEMWHMYKNGEEIDLVLLPLGNMIAFAQAELLRYEPSLVTDQRYWSPKFE